MTLANARLLVLPPERLAAELRRARAVEAGEREWRRGAQRLAACCAALYGVGLLIAASSLHLTGDAAQIALWGGLLVGNVGILVYCMVMWVRHDT